MTKLSDIKRGMLLQPRRVLLYGTHGVGKSTFAAGAPNPIFVPTEEGLGDIDCHQFPLCRSFSEVIDSLRSLTSEPHKFQTVVIDSLDWLERLIFAEVCREKRASNIEDIGYAKGYIFALSHWSHILESLNSLRSRAMHVILIAHSKIEKFDNPETESYDRYSPRLHKSACSLICEWCDEVLFATHRVFTKSTNEGFGRQRIQGIGTDERVLRTQERPAHIAKNRLKLPCEIPLNWSEFSKFLRTEEKK